MLTEPEPEVFAPTRAEVQGLEVGDLALACWGTWQTVTRIYAAGFTPDGLAYALFYTRTDTGSEISCDYTEGRICRTVPLCNRHTSADLDRMERLLAYLQADD